MSKSRMTKRAKNPVHVCGGGFERIDDADDGRPQFRCTKCRQTWTEGRDGGESLRAVQRKKNDAP